jgi:hypothetical protein
MLPWFGKLKWRALWLLLRNLPEEAPRRTDAKALILWGT